LTASYQQKQVSDLPIQVDWKPVFFIESGSSSSSNKYLLS